MVTAAVARTHYIIPAMQRLTGHNVFAEYLLMGTAAVESEFIHFVQSGGPAARGMFQMNSATYLSIIRARSGVINPLREKALNLARHHRPSFNELTNDHLFAAAMAIVKYASIHIPIPHSLHAQAQYWWTHYNARSKGLTTSDYLLKWNEHCAPLYPHFK